MQLFPGMLAWWEGVKARVWQGLGEDVTVPFWESMQIPFAAAHMQPLSCPGQVGQSRS